MRDYNQIQFKSPRKVKDHPLVVEDEKKEGSAASTAASTPTPPAATRKQLQSTPGRSTSSVVSTNSMNSSMSAQDALNVRREGAEATIVRLRSALEESSQKDTTAKAALAKSDAVILELRSSVRQLKRQLEKLQQEKEDLERQQRPREGGGQRPCRGSGSGPLEWDFYITRKRKDIASTTYSVRIPEIAYSPAGSNASSSKSSPLRPHTARQVNPRNNAIN